MRKLLLGLAAAFASAQPAAAETLFMGAYPNAILLVDEAKGSVVERLKLTTGLPTGIRMSNDKKRIYVTTITTSGIEVIDVASRKIINSFSLNTPRTRYRFSGGVPDPTGRYFYTIVTEITKTMDRFTVAKPKYAVVDLEQKKIVRSVEVPAEDEGRGGGGRGGGFQISDDGKFLYIFRDKVIVLNTADLKAVERIDLSKPEGTGFENIGFGGGVERISTPGQYVSLFNGGDPYVHNRVFGVGRFDLSTRQFNFTPIGPSPASMSGLQVTPDGREAYTVVTNGTLGNKRCEFWRFNMRTNAVLAKSEFQCKSRFQFGMSGNGRKLYVYGASFEIEVYDARTLKLEKTWDLGNDITGAGMVAAS